MTLLWCFGSVCFCFQQYAPIVKPNLICVRRSGKNDIGMSRLALSDADRDARDWFVETTKQLGCKVTVDAMGNTFAIRPGRQAAPPTCAGSHLDTQPSGGRYVCATYMYSMSQLIITNWT